KKDRVAFLESSRRDRRKPRCQIPSFSTTASTESPPWRYLACRRRLFIVSDFSNYAVARSDSISRQSSIGTMRAVGSPFSFETIWICVLATLFSLLCRERALLSWRQNGIRSDRD